MQLSRHVLSVIAHRVMHRATVIPDKDISLTPLVAVYVLRLCSNFIEMIEDQITLLNFKVFDADRKMWIDKNRFLASAICGPYYRMCSRRFDLSRVNWPCIGNTLNTPLESCDSTVKGFKILDGSLSMVRKVFIRFNHITDHRITTTFRNSQRVENSCRRRLV